MTDFSVLRLSKDQERLFYLAAAAGAVLISHLLYKNLLFSIVIVPFFPRVKSIVVNQMMDRRRRDYLMQFKDFLFIASTAIGAGRSMKDAIGESIPELIDIYEEKAVLVRELRIVYERIDTGNEDDVDVVTDLAVMSGMEDVIDFAAMYSTCKKTGASLILAMNRAAAMIIDKMTIDREIRELVRRKESEGMVIFSIPVIIVLFLNIAAPDYIAPMYETLAGRLVMTGVAAADMGIYELIQRIVKVGI